MIIMVDARGEWGGWYMEGWILEDTYDVMVMKIEVMWLNVVADK